MSRQYTANYDTFNPISIPQYSMNIATVSDYASISSNSNLVFASGDSITISLWAKLEANDVNAIPTFITKNRTGASSTDCNYCIRLNYSNTNAIVFYFHDSGGLIHIAATSETFPIETLKSWNHYAITFTFGTSASLKIYLNNVEKSYTWVQGSGASAPSTATEALWVGKNSVGHFHQGKIDKVKIYRSALSASEVTKLYERTPTTATPVLDVDFNEGSGTTFYDSSGYGNHLTLQGSASFSTDCVYYNVPLTICTWFNLSSLSGIQNFFHIFSDATNVDNGFRIGYNGTNGTCRAVHRAGTVAAIAEVDVSVSTNTWYFMAGVFRSNTNRQAYFGSVGGTGVVTECIIQTNANKHLFGTYADGSVGPMGTQLLSGKLAHTTVWNKALSSTEIGELASGMLPLDVARSNIIHYYPMLNNTPPADEITNYTANSVSSSYSTDNPVQRRRYLVPVYMNGYCSMLQARPSVIKGSGTWSGTFGKSGYVVTGSLWGGNMISSLPSWCSSFTPSGHFFYTWLTTTSDKRALAKPDNPSDRISACWYNTTPYTFTINVNDENPHLLTIYCLDWDSNSRIQTIEVKRSSDNVVLYTTQISSFNLGKWIENIEISSSVVVTITYQSGNNAVVSGVFFDEPDFKRKLWSF